MGRYVSGFEAIDRTGIAAVGAKGAVLGELSRLDGIRVPAGYCVTTEAFRRFLAEAPSIAEGLERWSRLPPGDREAREALGADLRRTLEATEVPDALARAITAPLARFGERTAFAVRSSATAEDLPTASFAGQYDTSLNVVGPEAIVAHVRRCWASLFTERSETYHLRNGVDPRKVQMGVVVQQMVFPRAAGVLFTADPVTGHRKVASVEATFGLGEALVSGRVNADVYRVRDGGIVARTVATKALERVASPAGGTEERGIAPDRSDQPALTSARVLDLVALGRRIEAHFGCPQDLEWCLDDEGFAIVQSRPITTLFPLPEADDGEIHVYVSVGHQQMMTDAMRPLGLSVFRATAGRPMVEAGGRLFVDVTRGLASPGGRAGLLGVLGRSDPLLGDALQALVDRGDVVPSLADAGGGAAGAPGIVAPHAIGADPVEADPARVAEQIARAEAALAATKRELRTRSGAARIEFVLADLQELRRSLFDPESLALIVAAQEASRWLDEQMLAWLGEKNVSDALAQSVPHNVTSEMGLALLDVADAIRPHPEGVACLRHADGEGFLDALAGLPGGRAARDALQAWFDAYGMRCVGEIDLTRPRWSERPSALVPLLLGHVERFAPGERQRRFERGRQEAETRERTLLERLRALPDGERKAEETRRAIARLRTYAGYREYPKYATVSRFSVHRQALLEEAERLVRTGVLREKEDVFYLTLEELLDAVRGQRADLRLVDRRKEAFRSYEALTPPRVLTSDGEVVSGAYRRVDLPPGAWVGLAVSAGTVEGRARVVLDAAEARLDAGDILVTVYTDPSWTPLFVSIAGLVTEVGGLMTHGAVIAREYGVPAVVGVEQATRRIRDGQRIRVHGSDGYVELLSDR